MITVLYILFLLGFIFGLLALTEGGVIVYKVFKKAEHFRTHIILGIVFVILCVICVSGGFFVIAQKIMDANINYEQILTDIGKHTGNITSDILKGFQEGMETPKNP